MSQLQNIRFRQVRPQANSSYESFNGEITFNFNIGNNEIFVPSETYLNVVVQLAQYGADNLVDPLTATTGISSSPVSCLFTNGTMSVNNIECCKISEYPQSSFIYNTLTKSAQKLQNNDSSDPVYLIKRYGISDLPAADQDNQVLRIKESLGIRNTAVDTDNLHVFEICQRLPLLITSDEVTGNTNFQIKLQVENNWRKQLLQSSVALGTVGDRNLVSTAAGTLKLDVEEIYLNVSLYETDSIPRSVKSSVVYKEMFSTTRTISANTSSERFVVTLPKNVESVFMCMFDSDRNTEAHISPTNLHCESLTALTSFEIRYGKAVFPSPVYQLNLSNEIATTSSRTRKNARAFKDFIYSTMDLSPNGSVYDLVSWASNPIFYYRVVKPIGDSSNDLDINLTFSGAHADSILYVGALFSKEMNIEYNDVGLVSQVEVKEIL